MKPVYSYLPLVIRIYCYIHCKLLLYSLFNVISSFQYKFQLQNTLEYIMTLVDACTTHCTCIYVQCKVLIYTNFPTLGNKFTHKKEILRTCRQCRAVFRSMHVCMYVINACVGLPCSCACTHKHSCKCIMCVCHIHKHTSSSRMPQHTVGCAQVG